jgi:hypothetical protein
LHWNAPGKKGSPNINTRKRSVKDKKKAAEAGIFLSWVVDAGLRTARALPPMTDRMTDDDRTGDRSVIRKSLIKRRNDAMTQMTQKTGF